MTFESLSVKEKKKLNSNYASFIFDNLPKLAKDNPQVVQLFIDKKLNENLKTYSIDNKKHLYKLCYKIQDYVNYDIVDQDYFNIWWEKAQWIHTKSQIERVLNRGCDIHE